MTRLRCVEPSVRTTEVRSLGVVDLESLVVD